MYLKDRGFLSNYTLRMLISVIGIFVLENIFGSPKMITKIASCELSLLHMACGGSKVYIRGMFEMNCLLSFSSISTWGTIKTNTYLYRVIQYLHNGV